MINCCCEMLSQAWLAVFPSFHSCILKLAPICLRFMRSIKILDHKDWFDTKGVSGYASACMNRNVHAHAGTVCQRLKVWSKGGMTCWVCTCGMGMYMYVRTPSLGVLMMQIVEVLLDKEDLLMRNCRDKLGQVFPSKTLRALVVYMERWLKNERCAEDPELSKRIVRGPRYTSLVIFRHGCRLAIHD